MSSYPPPREILSIFDALDYLYGNESLTLSQALSNFLQLTGGSLTGNLYAPNIFSSGSLGGTITTASQPNITSIGTLSSLTVSGNISGTLTTASQPNITSVGTLSQLDFSNSGCNAVIRPTNNYLYMGTSSNSDLDFLIERHGVFVARFSPLGLKLSSSLQASYPLDVNGDISGNGNWRNGSTILMDNTGLLQNASQSNITSVGSLTGLNLNGILSSTSNLIDCSSSLRITNGASPTTGSGGGFRYSGINSTFYVSSHNHFLSQHNRIDIQDHLIWISGAMDTIPDAVCFNTTTPQAKWQFHQGGNTSNRLRLSYDNTVSGDQYIDASGNHNFTNNLVCPSIGSSTGALSSNSSFRILGSNGFVSGESLELAYSTTNHQGNILCIDRGTGIQRKLTLGGQFTINGGDATIGYGVSIGGNPSGNVAKLDFYQSADTANRIRIGYDQTHYGELYCDNASILTFTAPIKANANTNATFPLIVANNNTTGHAAGLFVNSSNVQMEFGVRHPTDSSIQYMYYNGHFMQKISTSNLMSIGKDAVTPYAALSVTIGSAGQFSLYGDSNNAVGFSLNTTHDLTAVKIDRPVEIYNAYTTNYASTTYWLQFNPSGFYSASSASVATSLYTQYSIICNNTIYSSSDRRLKSNIKSLDIDEDTYMKWINPCTYDRVDMNTSQIGLVAQDLVHVHPLLIGFTKNDKMIKETLEDPDNGYQLNAIYDRIPMINACIIKKLIKRIKQLESKLSTK